MNIVTPESLLAWAIEQWTEEVKHRPLVNVHRRTLDDCWRQVVRFAGGDPDELLGPSHDVLASTDEAKREQREHNQRMEEIQKRDGGLL